MSTLSFRQRFFKLAKWFGALFIILFAFRMIYGYVATDKDLSSFTSDDFFSNIGNIRKNYASEKFKSSNEQVPIGGQGAAGGNQKFEKTASVKTKTSEFERDEAELKQRTKAYQAVVQYEQNIGNKGNRQLHLLIGVNPEQFDSFYLQIQKIGVIKATEITKVDKTNEYRQLNAKKASIEKTLQSLNELKAKGGEISDFVALNEKILEIEARAQELGVELGNFDTENEFCTVKLSMYEGATERKVSFIHRIKVALEWTIKYFAVMIFGILCAALAAFVLLSVADRFKLMSGMRQKWEE
jgi:Domain of unknown function (DUF4349)